MLSDLMPTFQVNSVIENRKSAVLLRTLVAHDVLAKRLPSRRKLANFKVVSRHLVVAVTTSTQHALTNDELAAGAPGDKRTSLSRASPYLSQLQAIEANRKVVE